MEFLMIILELIFFDIVFGGDNAVVIALATKNLDSSVKNKATFIGALLAICLRIIFVGLVMFLGEMHIPFLFIVGGVLLAYIALGLITEKDEEEHNIKAEKSMIKAIKTIVLADAIMSLDNAIVIAAIASKAPVGPTGELILVIMALLVSFPIILFGANVLIKLMDKFKFIVYVAAFLLIHVSLHMIFSDPILGLESKEQLTIILNYIIWILAIIIVSTKYSLNKRKR